MRPVRRRDRRADRGRRRGRCCAARRRRPRRSATCRWWPARSSSTCSSDTLRRGLRQGLPRPHAALAVARGLPHPADHQGRVRHRRRSVAGSRRPGVPVEFSKGEAGRGQHEINLDYTDRGRDGRPQPRLQDGGEGDRRAQRAVGHRSWPSTTSTTPARRCHIHSSLWYADGTSALLTTTTARTDMSETVPLVPRRPDRDRAASSACCGRRRSTATSGSSPARGRRPPSAGAIDNRTLGLPQGRPRRRHAGRVPHPGRRRQHLPRLRRRRSPAACTASANRSSRRRPSTATATTSTDLRPHPLEPRRRHRRCGSPRPLAKECLRRRRPPPPAQLRPPGVDGVQPLRHRLGAAPLLRTLLSAAR